MDTIIPPKRRLTLQFIAKNGPCSIRQVKKATERDYKNVYDDVKKLEQTQLLARIRDGPAKGRFWLTFRGVEAALEQGVDPKILLRINKFNRGREEETKLIDCLCSFAACEPWWNTFSKGEMVVAMLFMMRRVKGIEQSLEEYVKKPSSLYMFKHERAEKAFWNAVLQTLRANRETAKQQEVNR